MTPSTGGRRAPRSAKMARMDGDMIVTSDDLVIRRMRDDYTDYELMLEWRELPHIRRWWDHDLSPRTIELIRAEYRPDTTADSVSTACIIELADAPIGFIQFYRWASYAKEATEVGIPFDDRSFGIDVFIGVDDLVGQGIGTKVVTLLSDHLLTERDASEIALTTDIENHPAQRCYAKAGFVKIKKVLDTDTYMGERTWAWLMTKGPRAG